MPALQYEGGRIVKVLEFLFLIIGTFFDIREQELPLPFLLCFGILVAASSVFGGDCNIGKIFPGACAGGIFLIVGWLTKEAIGYGDGIGLMILGIFEGWPGMIPVVVGAFLLSGVYGIWRLLRCGGSPIDEMPFYPFLLISFMGVWIL